MKTIEAVGKSVEEAIADALRSLGVDRSQVQVEVVDEGTKGIFGLIGTKLARVRVTVKAGERVAAPPVTETPEEAQVQDVGDPEQKAAWGQTYLQELLSLLGVQAQVRVVDVNEVIEVELSGENMGLLIGHRGQTLDSIQYLVNLAADKAGHHGLKFVVDAERYRARRKETLEALASRLANKVVSRGRRAVLDPMTPQERRIIHIYLRDNADVCTYSEGKEPFRKVVIDLKK